MLCESCQVEKKKELFNDFSNFISTPGFKDSESKFQKEVISAFIIELTANEIKRSLNKNLFNTLNHTIKENLSKSFQNA